MKEILQIISLSRKDFFTKKFIVLSILPLICSVILLGIGVIWVGNEFGEILTQALQSGDFGWFDLSSYSFIMSIISHGIVHWAISAMFYALASYLMLMLSIIVALFIAGFLTPIITKEINQRHYNLDITPINTSKVIKLSLGVALRFLGILCLCLPFMFVPFLHFITINIPFFYLYHKFMLIDLGSNTLNENKFELAWLENGGLKFSVSAFVFYVISLVPLLGLAFQIYFIIFFSHILFRRNSRFLEAKVF
ncbi:MAG: EI24 domain-containing protein [Campylobacter sp.]|nr:EI24 domain-containing protein [Campylobacter sp.]